MRPLLARFICFLSLIGLLASTQPANAAGALTITSPPSAPTFPIGVVQMPLQATGGVAPYTFSISAGSLPPGFAIRSDVPSFFPNGVTSGIIGVATTPTGGSPYQFTVQVQDSTAGTPLTATLPITLHITGENFKDLNNLPDALVNHPYSYTFTVLNGTSPTVSLGNQNPSGCLTGLTLTGTTLSGTPTVASASNGSCNFQLQISDGGTNVSENFNLKVAALAITNAGILPNATQNTAYNGGTGLQLATTGGTGGYTYQIVNGGLPQGLNLSATGLISGTVCTCAGAANYGLSIKVTDSGANFYQQNFAMDVLGTNPVLPSLQSFIMDDATVGASYSINTFVSGGVAPYTWNVTGLPAGMSFRFVPGTTSSSVTPGNVEVWGVPQALGPNSVTFTATDSNGISVSTTSTFRVSALAFGFQGQSSNALGTVNTAISPPYQLRVIGGTSGYASTIIGGAPPVGAVGSLITFSGSSTGVNITGTPVENGNFNFRLNFTDSTPTTPNQLSTSFNLNVNPNTVQIFNNANLGYYPTGGTNTVNFAFNACCAQSGNLTWSVPATVGGHSNTLPTGLSLSASTGQLTGAVATSGLYNFFVQVADGSGNTATRSFFLTFSPIAITTNGLGYGNLNSAFTAVQFAATGLQGTPVQWSLFGGLLPPGMSISTGGLLGGTPTSTGQYNFTVIVNDGVGNSATRGYSLSIYPVGGGPPVSINNGGSLGTYLKGDLEADLFASGGSGTFVWSVQGGSNLPPGLSLRTDPLFGNGNAQAAIIGVATTPGNYSFTLIASSAGNQASQTYTMKITALNLVDGFNLPDAYGGVAYNYTLTPVNASATPTFTYAFASGSNPPLWLNINSSTGALSGTPVAPFNQYNFGITVSDGTDTVTRNFNLNTHAIHITCLNPACPNGQMPNATQGQTYTLSLASTDSASGTVTYTANNLPNGITISNGVISTNNQVSNTAFAGIYSVSVTATDGTDTTTQQFSLVVESPTSAQLPRLNFNGLTDPVVGQPYSTTIPVCCGGVGPSFTWSATGLPAGLFLRYAGSGTPGTASGTPNSGMTPGFLEIYGIPQTPSTTPSTVNLTVSDSTTPTAQTTSLSFNMHVSALDETANLPNPTIGQPYGVYLREVGGPPGYTVSLVGGALPAGMSLVAQPVNGFATAEVQGTPIESGNFNFKLHFVDSAAHTLDRYYGFNVAGSTDNINLQINTNSPLQSLVTGQTNVNIGLGACCTAAPYTWSVVSGALPTGLALGSSTGQITGTASPAGNYTFLVQVQDANNNTARRQFTLQISSLQITTNSIPYGNLGSAYNTSGFTMTATGGTTPLTWSLQSGTFLPPGLTFSSAGVISGTPTSTGQYFPTFVVTDSAIPANSTSISFTLNVYPAGGGPPLAIQTNGNLGTWSTGEYQIQFVATGGIGTYAWTKTAGNLPPGYAIRSDLPSFFSSNASAGLIGVGTTPGTYNFTLQVTSGQQTVSQPFSITITSLTTKEGNLPDAYVGGLYNGSAGGYTLTALNAVGGTATYALTSGACTLSFPTSCLPPGLSLASNGAITGTPSAGSAGSYTFTMSITDGTSTIGRQYTINTYAISINTAGVLPNATQGTAYSAPAITATGGTGTLTWSSNGVPNGFVLNSATGVISASPTFSAGPGRYQIAVTVTDQNNVSSVKRFALDVVGVPAALPQLQFGKGDDLTFGNPTSIDISTGSGGTGPFTYTATGLPPGMSIRAALPTQNNNLTAGDGEIWGTPLPSPAVPTDYSVTVTATDASTPAVTVSNTFTLHVSPLDQNGLPQGTINVSYNSGLRIVGGTAPYSFVRTVSGFLPDGLTLNTTGGPTAGGSVSGTPLESGGFNVTYQYKDSANVTLVRGTGFNIGNTSPLQINNNGNLGTVTVTQSYSNQLNVSGCCGSDTLTWSVVNGSTLPAGLNLTSGGLLSGTPTAAQVQPYTFLVEVADVQTSTNTAFRQFTMVVTPIALTSNNNLTFGTLAGFPSQTITTTGANGTVNWTLNPNSYLPPGLTLSGSTISGTPTSTGQYFFTLTGTDAAGNTIVRNFSVNIYVAGGGPPLSLTNFGPNVGPWSIGVQSIQLQATGGTAPYTYSLTPSAAVVPGCRVQNGTTQPTYFASNVTGGYLCLVPTTGTYTTSIRVTDSANNTFDRPITINVVPLLLEMQGTLPKGAVGVSYTYNPVATGGAAATGGTGAYTFSATNLPPGLSISSSTGAITGTPTSSGTFNPTITLGNASVTGTVGFGESITINPFAITTVASLPQGTIGSAYNQTLTASGCGTGCTWTISSGSLPAGLNLTTVSGNGSLSTGSGTLTGTFDSSFTIQASGSNGTTQQIFSLIVAPNTITALSITTNITSTSQLASSANVGLFANGGKPPYNFSLLSGSLPPNVVIQGSGDQMNGNLAPATQYLAGRPTAAGTYTFTLQVADSTTGTPLTATKAFSWTISPLSIQYGSLPLVANTLLLNSAYSQQILVVGGSGSYTSWTNPVSTQPLPSGLTLNSATGVISGTPTSTGNVSVPFLITDSAGATVDSNINVNVVSGATGTVTLNGPAYGTVVPLGSTQSYTITPSGGTGPYTISAVGALPAGVFLESGTTLGTNFGVGTYGMQATFSTPGIYTFTLQAVDSSVPALTGERTYSLTVPGYGPDATNTTLPQGSVGTLYSQQLYSFDNSTALAWSLTSGSALPPGLTISSTGVISGTPTTPGTYSFVLTFGDAAGSSTNTFILKISNLAITTSGQLPLASMNIPYGPSGAGVTLAATGGSGTTTWTITSGSLPSGLSLSGAGVISGTPSSGGGAFVFTVAATNTGGSVSKTFILYLGLQNPGTLNYPAFETALPDAILGQNYQFTLVPNGGVPPYTWSLASGSTLPPGFSLVPALSVNSATGPGVTAIAGLPSVAGPYTFSLVLTDSTGAASLTRTFTMNVTPISITANNPRNAIQGSPYSFQFEATGGTGPYSYSYVINPNNLGQDPLPPGLTLNGSGLISGTPAGTGTFSFTLTVTDTAGHSLTRNLTLVCTNSNGVQVNVKSGTVPVNYSPNLTLSVSGSNATYNWAVLLVTPTPASPIVQGLPAGISLQQSSPGVWMLNGSTTAAGTYQYVLQATNASNSSDVVLGTITTKVTPIALSSPVQYGIYAPLLPAATMGSSYSFQFVAAGGTPPYSFTEAPTFPVPPGMTLSSTGLLSGTPTQSGPYTIKQVITDSAGSVADITGNMTLVVTTPTGKPVLEPRSIFLSYDAELGVPFALTLDRLIIPGVPPFTWAATGPVPQGLSILHGSNTLSDILAGTPTVAGVYNFTLTATDSIGQTLAFQTGDFEVSVMSLSPTSLPTAVRGSSYSVALSVSGGTPPYTYQYDQAFTPPPGMSISGGVLSGTPTYAGVFPIGLLVIDNVGNTLTRDLEFSVDDAAGEVPSVAVAPKPVSILFLQGAATTSTPITVSSSSGNLPFNAALYGLPGTSLSAISGTTNGSVSLNFGSLAAGTYTGFLGVGAPGAVNAVDTTPVTITVLAPPPCTYTLSNTATSSAIGGDSGNIEISAGPGCAWTAAPTASPWITLTGATSGTGNGTVPYTTAANGTGSPRTGTVTITGSTSSPTFTINQFAASCSFSISPTSISTTAAGGSATVNITASGSFCAWTATGLSAAPTGGTGSGSVTVTIPSTNSSTPPPLTAAFSGSGYVETQTFTVNQTGANCTYGLSSPSALFDATGGAGSVNLTIAASGCPYNTVLGPSWINVTSGGSGTSTGAGQTVTLTYTIDPNSTTLPRTGALTIGGQIYAITEQALACSVSADTSTLGSPFASGGGTGVIGITTNGSNCSWNAASNVSFATVSPPTGFGNGTVTVTASSNAASTTSRTGSLTVSGQTISFAQGGTICSYSLRSSSNSMPSLGGLATASVVAPSACTWTAAPNASWLHIIASGSGGTADVSFTADSNASAVPRIGTLTIAGQTFTVNEGGAPCSFTLASSSSATLANTASLAPLTVNYTASTSGCATPAVTSYSSWITASNTFTDPTGTMSYSVAANPSGNTRTGNVQVGDKVFAVIQTGANCSYSMNAYGLSVNYIGATSNILGSANLGSCPNPPDGSTQPFVTVGTLTGTPSLYTLPFTVSPFQSATKTVRQGLITFGGQLFYIKQTSY